MKRQREDVVVDLAIALFVEVVADPRGVGEQVSDDDGVVDQGQVVTENRADAICDREQPRLDEPHDRQRREALVATRRRDAGTRSVTDAERPVRVALAALEPTFVTHVDGDDPGERLRGDGGIQGIDGNGDCHDRASRGRCAPHTARIQDAASPAVRVNDRHSIRVRATRTPLSPARRFAREREVPGQDVRCSSLVAARSVTRQDGVVRPLCTLRAAIAALIASIIVVTTTACASGAATSPPAEAEQISEKARPLGIAPDLVYTTDLGGYDLAVQSVGPNGAEGLSATWFNGSTGGMLTIRTDRGELTAETCPIMPLDEALDAAVHCELDDGGLWHRWAGDAHEFVAVREGVLIRATGAGTPPDDLRAAARAAHVPSPAELERLFSDAPALPTGPPVERGDLPEDGDGAPVDLSGPGG